MPETNNPAESSLPETPIGEQVYAYMPSSNTANIKKATVTGVHGPDAWLGIREGGFHRVHRSNVFTPEEVASAALDLMFQHPDGEEVHISKAVDEVIDHPLAQEELSNRLSLQALERYINPSRTLEELGVRDEEELLADAKTRGSNYWKIDELIKGVTDGKYSSGAHNELNLAHPSKDLETLPPQQATEVRQMINGLNRNVLDTLYDQYGVNFEEAIVLERTQNGIVERRTVFPSTAADFSFVETTYITEGEATSTALPDIVQAQIVVGKPDYSLEKGYTPAI